MGSTLRGVLSARNVIQTQVRNGGHYYFMLAAIPVGAGIFFTNLFYSNAQLSAIPEDYHPKEWEYYPNPITRFIVKHFKVGYQELHEVHLHNMWETGKVVEMKQLKAEVKRQMAIQGDYKGWYHRDGLAKYARQRKSMMEENTEHRGHKLVED